MGDLSVERSSTISGPIATRSAAETTLNTPYGGILIDLIVDDARASMMKATSKDHASITLDERALCDLELLAVGGFSPLSTFLGKADYERVVAEMRLADGTFWPLPVTLPVTPGPGIEEGRTVALRDVYGNLLAFLHISEIFKSTGTTHAGGKLEVIRTPPHYDFVELRQTPLELRKCFSALGWSKVAAFQTTRPLHRADEEFTKRIAERIGGGLLIHPIVGVPKPGDVDHYTRIRCYRALIDNGYEPASAVLSLLPQVLRKGGPRETLLHAIIRRNYGCTHFADGSGNGFSGHDGKLRTKYQDEIGIELVDFKRMVYVPVDGRYCPIDEVPEGTATADLSEAQVHGDYLSKGVPLPEWFSRPAVAEILSEASPPKFRQGLTIWFTGLSGSGKSTVAHALVERLAEYGRNVSLLDGDEIRTHLSKGLSFSKEDRDANINRVGYVAGLVAQHGGTTLCSVISPYRATRDNARRLSKGNFVEVYCDTPIEECEKRDVKGLYAKARAGEIKGFTGVDDPYEPPLCPEVTIDTSKTDVKASADAIIKTLLELGYILPQGHIQTVRPSQS